MNTVCWIIWNMRTRLSQRLALVLMLSFIVAGLVANRKFHLSVQQSVPLPPAVVGNWILGTSTPIIVTVSAPGMRAPWLTTVEELRDTRAMWRRLHLADWNAVAEPVRHIALDQMLASYRSVLNDPRQWDHMTSFDWDAIPQPIRTVAYRRMVAYWAGFYDVGVAYNLSSAHVTEMLAAIVMSESWFDHRAVARNCDGTLDVGLAQASSYARERIRSMHEAGLVDVALTDEDYLNPWMATRFVAWWMQLMLDETNGDLDLAVGAYHRGSGAAGDRLGAAYVVMVHRRWSRFIRNQDAPQSWSYLWHRSRAVIRGERGQVDSHAHGGTDTKRLYDGGNASGK